jgi:5-methylcytosine-specific restriction endonuclease McrA
MKQLPYECCCCGFKTDRKDCMRRHLYDRVKHCPKTVSSIHLTDAIRESILEYRVYHAPTEEEPTLPKPKRNKGVSSAMRCALWNQWFSETNGNGECPCCHRAITQQSFHAGHIVARAQGGADTLSNLVPLCPQCNTSMGTTNYHEFAAAFDCGAPSLSANCPRPSTDGVDNARGSDGQRGRTGWHTSLYGTLGNSDSLRDPVQDWLQCIDSRAVESAVQRMYFLRNSPRWNERP